MGGHPRTLEYLDALSLGMANRHDDLPYVRPTGQASAAARRPAPIGDAGISRGLHALIQQAAHQRGLRNALGGCPCGQAALQTLIEAVGH